MITQVVSPVRKAWREVFSWLHWSTPESAYQPFAFDHQDLSGVFHHLSHTDVSGPILTSKDVTDFGDVGFVADPFFHIDSDTIDMFFEVLNPDRHPNAVIGHARSLDNGREWEYNQIVLAPDHHLSFPYVFEHRDEIYMLPDFANTENQIPPVRLYRAVDFPTEWEPEVDIIDVDHLCKDAVVFQYQDRWWALIGSGGNDELRIYYNDSLTEPGWDPHPMNPVVSNRVEAGRPGGRPIVGDDTIMMPFQDCSEEYGHGLRTFEITELTPDSYHDRPIFEGPMLGGTGGLKWNSGRMHHLDAQQINGEIYCAVDGDIGVGRNILSGSMWSISFGSSTFAG